MNPQCLATRNWNSHQGCFRPEVLLRDTVRCFTRKRFVRFHHRIRNYFSRSDIAPLTASLEVVSADSRSGPVRDRKTTDTWITLKKCEICNRSNLL
ncbi:hypothetical protein RRG08_048509 [Elysia crispata]|uniref:Uncharacterized protein n=1 Tax=Elysia crispata TaxID=231223 RepID=A0AAE0YFF0_9GAST|nr:hypothetical protein RRG08_048509 [Elysia crispata]